jgi:hypothetical protein
MLTMPGKVVDGTGARRRGRVLRAGGWIAECHRKTPTKSEEVRKRSGDDPPTHIAGKPVLAPARSRRAGALPLRAEVSDGVPLRESEPEIASRPPDRKHSNTDLGSARNKLLFGRPVAFKAHGGLQTKMRDRNYTVTANTNRIATLRAPITAIGMTSSG